MKASTPKPIPETAGQQCARWLKAAKLKARETNTVLGWDQVAKIIDTTLAGIAAFQPVKAQNSEVSSLGVASRHVTSDVTKSQLAGVIANLTCNGAAVTHMDMYNKIFTKILDSSIWLESNPTRIVWFTFLAAMDEDGFVQFASIANVAHRAIVDLPDAEKAILVLESPDADSSDKSNDGRRIERVPGGWIVLNAAKYRSIVTRAAQQEKTRERVARFRANKKSGNAVCNGPVTPSETGAVSGSEAEPIIAPKVRERNPLFDAIAEAEGSTVTEITKSAGGRIAKALMEIKSVSPDVTVEEIKGRAEAYKRLYPKAACTSTALATHWAKLDSKANSSTAPKPRDYTKL